jgi:RNA polymerase sigma-70 factor, ECF subfamily
MADDVVRRLVQGGDAAWAQFVRDYRLVAFKAASTAARRFGASPSDVEDAVSELFVELLKDDKKVLRAYRGDSAFSTWLTVVAYRVGVREFSRRARAREVDSGKQPVEPGRPDAEVLTELAKLPERERRALILFHVEEASYQEISSRLGIPVNQVGMVLLRAREALAKILSGK